ncbi:alcohol dehydrogenase catalytic domain-containing protein [candidate division KSB1 bacterium]|nr:alcohol dehydrogenase catalytic domain-containing protein [candidate division KSB1 bacterium]
MSNETGRMLLLDKPDGDLILHEFPLPDPAPGTVLARIELCGICGTDMHTWHAPQEAVFGVEYPISLGHEISAVITALGKDAKTDSVGKPIKKGDRIGLIPAIHCGQCYFCKIAKTPEKCTSWISYGTWAKADQEPHFTAGYSDYIYLSHPNSYFLKSDTTAERTAFLEPMAVVVHGLLHANIQPGDTVVVNGAGPIGLLTVAASKIAGASRVIATDKYNRTRLDLAREMGADLTMCHLDIPEEKDRKEFVYDNSFNLVGADVVINAVGVAAAFKESLGFVRDSGTMVEVGNFVDSGTIPFNPCKDLLERGIKIIGSFDNEALHFVRSMPLIADPRLPIEKLISHRVPLGAVPDVLTAIQKNEKYEGKEMVKVMMDPSMPEK